MHRAASRDKEDVLDSVLRQNVGYEIGSAYFHALLSGRKYLLIDKG
jgi:hypothetical protein